ncbi:MAG: carboxypeptidase-like regulatory domain-containing protein, partial [Bacteroidales bacterium]
SIAPEDPNRLRIKGTVKDKATGEELPFATIIIHNTNKGIISNLQGEFSFVYPASKENPILVVSVIGYKNAYVHVNPENSENLKINLEKDVISLQEVLIRYQNPKEIITNMRENIPGNYLSQRSSMTAYFREYVQKNNDFLTFSEAIIGIDKSSYNQFLKFDNVELIRGRKVQNISSEDSVLLKIQSGVNSSLQLDIIKNLPDFLSAEFADEYQYEFRNMVSYKNQYVYHLGFKPGENINTSQYRGDLYINKEDYSLLSAEFEVDPRDLRKNPERFLIRKSRFIRIKPLKASYKVEYRSTAGEYHLSMVKAEVKFRIRKRGEWIGSQYNIVLELAVTEVDPGTRNRIPRKQRLRPNSVLSEEEFTYDPEFWGNYDIIEPEASLQSALKKMGIEWTDF